MGNKPNAHDVLQIDKPNAHDVMQAVDLAVAGVGEVLINLKSVQEKAKALNDRMMNNHPVNAAIDLNDKIQEVAKVANTEVMILGIPEPNKPDPKKDMQAVINQLNDIFKELHKKNNDYKAILVQATKRKNASAPKADDKPEQDSSSAPQPGK